MGYNGTTIVDFEMVKANALIRQYLGMSDQYLGVTGRIQHDEAHAIRVAESSKEILIKLGYPDRGTELAAIAGYLHDIGNLVNRYQHGMIGAVISFCLLTELGMDPDEMAVVMSAIGNHEEDTGGFPVNYVAAAVILADKSNVHRSRVRKTDPSTFTQRDRVNYAVEHSDLKIDPEKKLITMQLIIDTEICSVMEYFEIFLTKMVLCRRASKALGCEFELIINNAKLL